MSGESNIERDRRKRSLIDTPRSPMVAPVPAVEVKPVAVRVDQRRPEPFDMVDVKVIIGGELETIACIVQEDGNTLKPYNELVGGTFPTVDEICDQPKLWRDLGWEQKAEGRRRFEELLATPNGASIRLYPPLSEFRPPAEPLIVDDDGDIHEPPREFRTRPGKLKPGSLTAEGHLIDRKGRRCPSYADVNGVKMTPMRRRALMSAGWRTMPQNGWLERTVAGR